MRRRSALLIAMVGLGGARIGGATPLTLGAVACPRIDGFSSNVERGTGSFQALSIESGDAGIARASVAERLTHLRTKAESQAVPILIIVEPAPAPLAEPIVLLLEDTWHCTFPVSVEPKRQKRSRWLGRRRL